MIFWVRAVFRKVFKAKKCLFYHQYLLMKAWIKHNRCFSFTKSAKYFNCFLLFWVYKHKEYRVLQMSSALALFSMLFEADSCKVKQKMPFLFLIISLSNLCLCLTGLFFILSNFFPYENVYFNTFKLYFTVIYLV